MHRFKKLTAGLLALCFTVGTAAFVASCGGGDDSSSSPADSSQSSSSTSEEKTEYTLTVAVVKEDGTPLSGISFTLTGSKYEESATTDEEGKATFSGALGSYTLTLTEGMPAYHVVDVYSKTVTLSEDMTVTITVEDMTPDGSEEKPFTFIVNDDGEMSVLLPANATYHYDVYRALGQSLVIENENVEVSFNGVTYAPENGKIVVPFGLTDMREMAHFTVSNKSDGELQLTFKLQATAQEETFALTLGEAITASVTGDGTVKYTWTATANGVLRIASDSNSKSIGVSVAGVTEVLTEDDSYIDVDVNVGDAVVVAVSALSNASDSTVEIVFTATFTEE